jgi:hypothetical protein
MRAVGRIVSRDELSGVLYQRQTTPYERSLDVHVSHLRRKLEGVGLDRIRTVRGQGYICVERCLEMRSLPVRIVLAVLGTLLVSLVAFMATFLAMSGPANVRLIRQFQARQIEDGIATLQQRGPDAAAAFIARLDQSLGATHYLTDAAGRD